MLFFLFIQYKGHAQQLSIDLTPSLNAFGYNITCFGMQDGYINLTINNGTGPYLFNWSNRATTQNIAGLAAGYYSVKVLDLSNGATNDANITLIEPEPIFTSVRLFANNYSNGFNVSCSSCYDGSIATSVESGVSPFLFEWNDGVTTPDRAAIHAGAYAVTVTGANGCAASEQIILTSPEREDWTAYGNSGSNPGIHFLGTIDNKDMVFKTNNLERMRIKSTGSIKIPSLSSNSMMYSTVFADSLGNLVVSSTNSCFPSWLVDPARNTLTAFCPNNNIKVGIGTRYPLFDLEVFKENSLNARARMKCQTGSAQNAEIWTINSNGSFAFATDASGLGRIYSDVNTPFPIITFSNNGKVGIGVDPPAGGNTIYKLFVADGIATRDIKVQAIGWPDYVFEKDNKLMSIYELDNYIIQNKHLPGVKSADEIKNDDGFSVSEMQTVLLKKIEEQTLYIIGLQKQVDELKNKIKN